MSRVDAIREKIKDALYRQHNCITKAQAYSAAGDNEHAYLCDSWASAAEKEADALFRELLDADRDEAMASRRDYLRDVSYGRQG